MTVAATIMLVTIAAITTVAANYTFFGKPAVYAAGFSFFASFRSTFQERITEIIIDNTSESA